MAACDVCGNEYESAFTVTQGDRSGVFDSFECAAHAMAPTCAHCGCRILGHGVQVGDGGEAVDYCCAHCARTADGADLADRA